MCHYFGMFQPYKQILEYVDKRTSLLQHDIESNAMQGTLTEEEGSV
jgi:hypothetical protein